MEVPSIDQIKSRLEQTVSMGSFPAGSKNVAGVFKISEPNEKWDASNEEVANFIEETTGCSCTDFKVSAEGIGFTYKDDTKVPDGASEIEVRKNIGVYFADGKPLKIRDPQTGNMIYNPNKLQLSLSYKGKAQKV